MTGGVVVVGTDVGAGSDVSVVNGGGVCVGLLQLLGLFPRYCWMIRCCCFCISRFPNTLAKCSGAAMVSESMLSVWNAVDNSAIFRIGINSDPSPCKKECFAVDGGMMMSLVRNQAHLD